MKLKLLVFIFGFILSISLVNARIINFTMGGIGDTSVQSDTPSTNYGTGDEAASEISLIGSNTQIFRGYFMFPNSSVNGSLYKNCSSIINATMILSFYDSNGANNIASYYVNDSSNFTETLTVYNNQPCMRLIVSTCTCLVSFRRMPVKSSNLIIPAVPRRISF